MGLTMYAGQLSDGKLELIHPAEDHMDPVLFFSETDRQQASRAISMMLASERSEIPSDLYNRLDQISKTDYNRQANYFLDRIHEIATRQGRVALANLVEIEHSNITNLTVPQQSE